MMSRVSKAVLTIAAFAVVGAGFAQGPDAKNAMEGKKLPTFTMKDLAGKPVTNATLKGKVVVFDFWATWCGPCMKASPLMQSLHKKYASKGLMVIGAKVQDENGSAANYAKEHGYSYKFTNGGDALFETFKVPGIPCFVFVDKKGVVNKVQIGYGPELEAVFDKKVQALLAAK